MRTFLCLALAACLLSSAAALDLNPGVFAEAPAPDLEVNEKNYTSIADFLDSRNQTSILWAAVQAAGLEEALSDPELVATLFAPEDDAFTPLLASLGITADQLLADTETLKQACGGLERPAAVLAYHVVPGRALMVDELADSELLQTLLDGPFGQVKVLTSRTGATKSRLKTTSDQQAKIHGGDVLAGSAMVQRALQLLCLALAAASVTAMPAMVPAAATAAGAPHYGDFDIRSEWGSVLELITKKSDDVNGTGLLLEALDAAMDYLPADLVTDLSAGNWTGTVLAPTNEAFEALGDKLDVATPEQLAKILAYHLIPDVAATLGNIKALDGQVVETLLGGTVGELKIRKGGKKAAPLTTSGQDVPVYQYNLGAGSAVVHTIKQVLIPGNLVLTADAAAPSPVLASTWRYASAVQSTDSDTYSEHDAADPTAPPGASLTPTATGSPASTPGGDSAANQQLWSPSKRSQAQAPFAHRPPAPPGQHPHAGFGGAALGTLPPPPGIDPASFQAGERAAFLMAFQQALPGQQALGQLFSAVDSLHSRLEEEAAAWRSMHLGASKADGLLQAALQRLDALEHGTLPQLQHKWEESARRAPEQLAELVGGLSQVVALLAAQRQLLLDRQAEPLPPGARGAAHRQLPWLVIAAAGYAQAVLSRADVAALFLSRKILLTDPAPGEEARGMRSALGAALFVAAVEAAWQAQRRLLRPLPSAAHRAAAPLQLGLKAR
ncbi:beta-Ig-H3 fasciclin [Micractinium conductrix]|uniref:Beta-Ig-H3 fasciclin n=1 Tax=Micractinium conductrix TaxID=554055 RepID=A0A2P6V030_9CHLO|nr:beta-Ig-H3 fasciclin [Micractinium conductrix]|eukprot:PSC67449.1 beta-Ig-H3 fasciclin [Micractinium conductrix]